MNGVIVGHRLALALGVLAVSLVVAEVILLVYVAMMICDVTPVP